MNKTQKLDKITDIIYSELNNSYCYNCRFDSEIEESDYGYEEDSKYKGGYGCEDCHRKYMGWEISKTESKNIAKKIIAMLEEK